jgi:hypothetical protein
MLEEQTLGNPGSTATQEGHQCKQGKQYPRRTKAPWTLALVTRKSPNPIADQTSSTSPTLHQTKPHHHTQPILLPCTPRPTLLAPLTPSKLLALGGGGVFSPFCLACCPRAGAEISLLSFPRWIPPAHPDPPPPSKPSSTCFRGVMCPAAKLLARPRRYSMAARAAARSKGISKDFPAGAEVERSWS